MQFLTSNNTLKIILILLGLLFLSHLSINFLLRKLLTVDMIYDEMTKFIEPNQVINLLHKQVSSTNYMQFVKLFIFLLLRICFVFFCLAVGLQLTGVSYQNLDLFKAAIIADYAFLVPKILKYLWFEVIQTQYSLPDLRNYNDYSLVQLLNLSSTDLWLEYPLRVINIFEVFFIIMITFSIREIYERSYLYRLKFVCLTYGSGLVIYTIILAFVGMSLS